MEQSTDEADKSDNKSSNSEIDAELAGIKAQSDEINDKLTNDLSLTQGDMNQLSAQMYKLWDDELNSIWGRLRISSMMIQCQSSLRTKEIGLQIKKPKLRQPEQIRKEAHYSRFWRIVRQQS